MSTKNRDSNPTRSSAIDQATQWYIEAVEAGQPPDEREMRSRFPQVYEQLLQFAQDYELMNRVAKGESPVDDKAPPEVLTSLGDFRLIRQIGRGGMGVVYKARQNSLNRIVALKLILAGKLASAESVRRFQREANAAAQLRHPHIVSVYDYQECEGQHYLAMEYVHGPTLADLIRENTLDLTRAVQIMCKVAGAIAYAHEQGIIHRDIKPANVILEHASFEPRLTDFGLAKKFLVDANGTATVEADLMTPTENGLTGSGSLVGTYLYMAPEQTHGGAESVGPPADIYGLGATLYELLTGRPPFRASDIVRLLVKIREDDPTPPRRIDEKIPVDLQLICLKCLEKEAARRYTSAQALADDLGRYLQGEAVLARAAGPVRRAAKWIKRNRQTAALMALAAAALLVVTGGGYVVAIREALHSRINRELAAEEAAARAEAELLLAQSYNEKGLVAIERGDVFAALPAFVGSMDLSAPGSDFHTTQQLRCQTLLSQAPELTRIWFHEGSISDLEFAPGGSLLAVSSYDRTTSVWSIQTGELAAGPLHHEGIVFDAEFDQAMNHIVTAAGDAGIYLWDLAKRKSTIAPAGKEQPVSCVAFHPNGLTLVAGSGQKNLALSTTKTYVAPTFKRVNGILIPRTPSSSFQLPARGIFRIFSTDNLAEPLSSGSLPGWVNHVCYSGDGQWLLAAGGAIGSPDAKLIDAASGETKEMAWKFTGDINHAAFARRHQQVLFSVGSFGRRGYAEVWDIESKQVLCPKLEHADKVIRAFFLADAQRVVTASWDGSSRIWQVATGMQRGLPMMHGDRLNDAAMDDLQQLYATASRDGTARVWHAATGTPLSPPLLHRSPVTRVAWSPDGQFLATGDNRGVVRLWKIFRPHELAAPPAAQRVIIDLVHEESTDGIAAVFGKQTRLAYSSTQGLADEVIQLQADRVTAWRTMDQGGAAAETWIADAKLGTLSGRFSTVVEKGDDQLSQVTVIDLLTGETSQPLSLKSDIGHAVASHDGERLFIATGAEQAVWKKRSEWVEAKRMVHSGPVRRTIVSRSSKTAVTLFGENQIQLWDTHLGTAHDLVEIPQVPIGVMAFSPDGKLFVASTTREPFDETGPCEVHYWTVDQKQHVGPLSHAEPVKDIAFDLDRGHLITACEDGIGYFWDLNTGSALSARLRHRGAIHTVRLSPDGEFIATASADGTARLWDAETGLPMSADLPHPSGVRSLVFIDHGKHLATGCDDGIVRKWPLPTGSNNFQQLRLRCELLSVARTLLLRSAERSGISSTLTVAELKERWLQLR